MQLFTTFDAFYTTFSFWAWCLLLVAGGAWAKTAPAAPPASGAPIPMMAQADAPPMRSAKRAGPSEVPPVRMGRITYNVIHWGRVRDLPQNGGYIAATDSKSGKELWILKIYDTKPQADLERDVQDVFITSMRKGDSPHSLVIDDEAGRSFVVDVKKRVVKPHAAKAK
jgi:hypothetical protein